MSAPPAVPARTLVWGVLNTTPDSFSDGGRWPSVAAAVDHGLAMAAQGADAVDVGGESTRPGAGRVDPELEAARVVPVVRELARAGVEVSVDTTRASVAAAALDAGAVTVNDVSGALEDPAMAALVAASGARCVLSHWRGPSAVMAARARYDDVPGGVVAEVRRVLAERVAALVDAGADPAHLAVDPGLGFAKDAEHDWALLAALPALVADGVPVLVGASRKRFLGALLAGPSGGGGADGRGGAPPRPVDDRDDATAATTALAAAAGAWAVRVHAVRASADAVRVAQRWAAA